MLDYIRLLEEQIVLKNEIIDCYKKIQQIDEKELERLNLELEKIKALCQAQEKHIQVLEKYIKICTNLPCNLGYKNVNAN